MILDLKTIDLEMKVGVLENYRPNKEIKALFKDVQDLKQEFSNKLLSIVGDVKTSQEAGQVLNEDAKKRDEWTLYLKDDFESKFRLIKERVYKVNQRICPNFDEVMSKK